MKKFLTNKPRFETDFSPSSLIVFNREEPYTGALLYHLDRIIEEPYILTLSYFEDA